ncbi:MAG: cell envelope integrity protein CreD [bacterium]
MAFKLGTIGTLVLLLLIPLGLLQSRLNERLRTRNQAISEITRTWGSEQFVAGPFLQVPYTATVMVRKDVVVNGEVVKTEVPSRVKRTACFLPSDYVVQCKLDPSERYRGIYKAVVYRGDFTIRGAFARPDFTEWKIADTDVLWDEAALMIAVTDLRGVTNALSFNLGGKELPLRPGTPFAGFPNTLRAHVPAGVLPGGLLKEAGSAQDVAFSFALGLNGSGGTRIAPLGLQTRASFSAPWPDPNFQGAFLPTARQISAAGFTAQWQVAYYGRGYPQAWLSGEGNDSINSMLIEKTAFGVDLYSPVDSYRLVERSVKYGILFIVLIFTGFFLFETLGGLRIHAMQYTLVGAALCLFYLTLLALSELMAFGTAYLIGAVAAGGLVTFYSASVLKGAKRAGIIAVELAVIFTFLYTTLQLQDYALLLGTVGLFISLGVVMYATRNVDWYSQGSRR